MKQLIWRSVHLRATPHWHTTAYTTIKTNEKCEQKEMKMEWKWTPVPCWAVIRLGSMMIYYFTFSILWHCSRMLARTAGWECIRESGLLQVRGDMITLPWMNPQRQQSKTLGSHSFRSLNPWAFVFRVEWEKWTKSFQNLMDTIWHKVDPLQKLKNSSFLVCRNKT